MQPLEQSVKQFPPDGRITTLPLGSDAFEFGRLGIIRGLSRVDGTLLAEPTKLTCELSLIESAESEPGVQPLDLAVDVLDCTGSGVPRDEWLLAPTQQKADFTLNSGPTSGDANKGSRSAPYPAVGRRQLRSRRGLAGS